MAAQPSAAGGLLGPPEIYHPPSSPTEKRERSTGESFIDLMDASFNSVDDRRPPMGLTENASPTFLSTGNPLLDFFFHVVPDTPPETLTFLLSAAWDRDPLSALKLVLHLRGVRGAGKSDRESFYTAALWLHLHHPKTLALNLPSVAEFGYFKDLPEILHRLIDGAETRKLAAGARASRRKPRRRRRSKKGRSVNKRKKQGTEEERLAAELARVKLDVDAAASLRRKKRREMASRAVDRYDRDPHYRFLHDRVSEHFAAALAADISHLAAGELGRLSLAAKWCPSLDSCFDRSTLLCESIARRLFPRESDPDLAAAAAEDAHYAYRVRDRLRRALVPLRRALEIPEVYMSAGRWDSLPYSRVPSVAMKNYKEIFKKHNGARFSEFLSKVKEGEAKIAAGALLPHEILASATAGEDDDVAELQWRRMVSDMAANGRLQNCIAVCDVSGSMSGIPMEVCVALGLLVSELSDEPWQGRVITFSGDPQLHKIEGTTIKEKTDFVRMMDWGMNTDLQKVFDRLLEVAIEGKLPPEKMIKRVFVFSDMEFDAAGGREWETDYEVICRKFQENGYGSAVPEIVFWNLRSSRSTPVAGTKPGVALVSGFSKNLMKLFLEGSGVISPMDVMESAIAGEEYNKLKVFD